MAHPDKSPVSWSLWGALGGAALLLVVANAVAPAPSSRQATHRLPVPAPTGLLKAASLGRHDAAADVLWLQAVQFIGTPGADEREYPGLGPWMGRIVELSPRYERAYLVGGILLSTSPEQADDAATLLDRAEQTLVPESCRAPKTCALSDDALTPSSVSEACAPCEELDGCSREIPLWRGFVAYFGQLDAKAAARHFCEARRRGGPKYLTPFTTRLLEQSDTCAALRRDLGEVIARGRNDANTRLVGGSGQLRIVLNCEKEALKQASAAFRLRFSKPPSDVEELLREGLLAERPFAPPGQCWQLGGEDGPAVGPCPEAP